MSRKVPTLTKKELVALLEDFNDDSPVYFVYPAGDYWRTLLCGSIKNVNEHDGDSIEYSGYHNKNKVNREFMETTDGKFEAPGVILLSTDTIF